MSHKVENHPSSDSPESPEPRQQELALAWLDRELAKAKEANAPHEAAAHTLERARKYSKPITRNVPEPPIGGKDHEDWVVEKFGDAYEEEQAEHLLYDDDPERDRVDQWLDGVEYEHNFVTDYINGHLDSDSDIGYAEELIERYAAREMERRNSESGTDSAAA